MRSIRPRAFFLAVGFVLLEAAEARAAPPPRAPESFPDVLRQTAAVVEGDVEDVSFRYDDWEGPRTVATLTNIVVHLGSIGSSVPRTLELRSFGGLLPDGREVVAMHVPAFVVGQRHVVFLRNTEWSLSPVAFGFAFRLVQQGSAEALIDPSGRLVMGVGMSGPLLGMPFDNRSEGPLDSLRPTRFVPIVAEDLVDQALDAREFMQHLRAFAKAMDAWPSGSFSMVPVVPHALWSFVATTPAEGDDGFGTTDETAASRDEDLLACFAPREELADTTVSGGATCDERGVP